MLKKDYFKKNLLRVKQLADQNLGRAEKTEVLTEELVNAEKRVELIKQVCHNSSKKIYPLMQGTGTADMEKKLKKIPESNLSAGMSESATLLGDGLLVQVLNMCSEAEESLGRERLQHELDIETSVLTSLQAILDNDIPSLIKIKKQLTKLVLDMDSARSRWHSAARQTGGGGNMAQLSAKVDTLKDEMDEASTRVEQCKDQYATDMYTFLAREPEVSERFIELVQAQANYHRNAAESLERILPKMKDEIQKYSMKPVYGCSLVDHLDVTGREISLVIEECVCTLLEIGMEEEGLFRIAGAASKLKKLKAAFNAGAVDMAEYVSDVPAIAGALKLYLRELPDPLLTFNLHDDWMQAAQIQDKDERLQALWVVLDKLPQANYKNLRYIVKFLSKLTEHSDITKMNASNLAIVIGPNILWSSSPDISHSVISTSIHGAIMESLIVHADWFFPGEFDFIDGVETSENVRENTAPTTESTTHRRNNSAGNVVAAPPPSFNNSLSPSSDSNLTTPSPKMTRRATKKPAPLPPQVAPRIPEREAPPPPILVQQSTPLVIPDREAPPLPPARTTSLSTTSQDQENKSKSLDRELSPLLIDPETVSPKSKSLERPTVAPPERPHDIPKPTVGESLQEITSERQHGAPPERPSGPPPERPQAEKAHVAPPDRPPAPDRPVGPPPERPIESKRASANKPPRPQPPPPPTPASDFKERNNSFSTDTQL